MDSPLFTRFLPFLDRICIHRNSRDVADIAPFFVYLLLHSRGQLQFDAQGVLMLEGSAFEQAFASNAQDVRQAAKMLWDPTFPKEREKLQSYKHIQELLNITDDTPIDALRAVYLDAAKEIQSVPVDELLEALPDLWMEILAELRAESYYADIRNPHCCVPHIRSAFLSLALHIYPPKEGDRVYVPFAAPEEYIPLLSKQQVVAQDALPLRWAIGTLTLLAQGYQGFSYRLESSAMAWQDTGDFDLLMLTTVQYKLDYVSAQAIGGYLGHRVLGDGKNHPQHYEYARYGVHAVQFVVDRALSSLNEHGKAVIVLPEHFLWQVDGDKTPQAGYWESMRRRLIAQDILDVAILLPQGKHYDGLCLIGLNKKKDNPGYFRLFDATSYVEQKTRAIHHLQILRRLEQGANKHLAIVPLGHVQREDYKITPMRYSWRQHIPADLQDYPMYPLSDFLQRIHLEKTDISELKEGDQIRCINHYSIRNYVRHIVPASQIDAMTEALLPYASKTMIAKNSCLLLSVCRDSIDTIWFDADEPDNEEPIYIQDLDAFYIDGIQRDYLIWVLKERFVRKQLGVMDYEGVTNVMDVLIPFPPLEVQEAKGMPAKNTYLV